jgi:acyl-[acyl-carrier-protein]-phospholipid O-acyltransferase/long-chain-fatty-acid--[acyl-carrier-protein] ligase
MSESLSAPAGGTETTRPWKRGFWSLFAVQFQGAFSDNVFKFLVIFLIARSVDEAARDNYISLILALFSLPFLLFSMAAGYLADRYPKPKVIVGTKLLEVFVMLAGTIGLYSRHPVVLAAVLFFMSVQSAFFGPSKYGILPEMLPRERLSWGNGFLGLGTFLAIIVGGILAGLLSDNLGPDRIWLAGAGLVLLALAGLTVSQLIPAMPAADPEKVFHLNFLSELWINLKIINRDRILKLTLIGSVYFWFIAALFGEPTILVYGQDVLGVDDTKISILRAFLAVGIAAGCGLAGFLSGRKIEYGLVPLGAMGMAAAAAVLFVPNLEFLTVGITLWLMGIFGGFYDIPVTALLQDRPDPKMKGSVLATNGWMTSAGVFAASGIFWLLKSQLGLSPNTIFLIGAVFTAGIGLYAQAVTKGALSAFLARIARGDFQGRNDP